MSFVEEFEHLMSSWPEVSVHPHRFGGREFRFGSVAEIGHIHPGGILDIPFPRPIRDALLNENLAEEHHWVPNSGWITYRVQSENDFAHALWLMRLSYLRYALKTAAIPGETLEKESEQLNLSVQFKSLLQPFARVSPGKRTAQSASA